LHRDIKPNNILLDKNNLVKFLDFGISKELGGIDLAKICIEHAVLYGARSINDIMELFLWCYRRKLWFFG
jgi:serine/threonine protein kinase